MLIITLIALVVLVTNQSVMFLQRAAGGGVSAQQVLMMTGLQVPLLLGYLMPLGMYLAVLLTLTRLHLDSEMVVLSACGVSRFRVMRMLLVMATFVAGIVLWLMLVAVPKAQQEMNAIYASAKSRVSLGAIIPGRFVVLDQMHSHVIFYARKAEQNHKLLSHVFFAQKQIDAATKQLQWSILVAKTAREERIAQVPYVEFRDGRRYVGVPGERNYRVYGFKKLMVALSAKRVPLHQSAEVKNASMSTLIAGYHASPYAASELQWRLAMPISVFTFVLLAMPLSEVRPRYGKFTQLFPAMLIYLFYADAMLYARNAISDGRIFQSFGFCVHAIAILLAIVLMVFRGYFSHLWQPRKKA